MNVEILQYIDYVGTFAFAITGAFIAAEIGMDLFGIMFLAILTAVGGGTVRDIVLDIPVFWLKSPNYIVIAICASPIVFIIKKPFSLISKYLFMFDTCALAFFAVIGIEKALFQEVHYFVAFVMGIISAVLGGIIRSLFSREVSVLYSRELYATVAAFASFIYLVFKYLNFDLYLSTSLTVILTFLFRITSIKLDLSLPRAKKETSE